MTYEELQSYIADIIYKPGYTFKHSKEAVGKDPNFYMVYLDLISPEFHNLAESDKHMYFMLGIPYKSRYSFSSDDLARETPQSMRSIVYRMFLDMELNILNKSLKIPYGYKYTFIPGNPDKRTSEPVYKLDE